MKEITKKIAEAMEKIGEEKLKSLKSYDELIALLKESGANLSDEEIKEALTDISESANKAEVTEETLNQVVGGFDWGWTRFIPGVGPIIDLFNRDKKKGGGGGATGGWGDAEDSPSAPDTNPGGGNGGGGNNQNNSGNSGIQQNNQTGNNTNSGGMSQSK